MKYHVQRDWSVEGDGSRVWEHRRIACFCSAKDEQLGRITLVDDVSGIVHIARYNE